MRSLVEISFVLFLLYTVVYLVQWFCGLLAAVYRLSECAGKSLYIEKLFPGPIAGKSTVSVLVPAYNEVDCICETIDSLLEESWPGLEILVIDDGSLDCTESLLVGKYKLRSERPEGSGTIPTKPVTRAYRSRVGDKVLRLLCKENGGKSDALNCGLNACRGVLCVILDADTRVQRGSLRLLVSRFLLDERTIVCAGAVSGQGRDYRSLSLLQWMLVSFQRLEYCRTFYLQRILFDRLNANIIVSGAFAMFRVELLRAVGGYRTNTIGEDMELTMRLHAFCLSNRKDYRIAYMPEARCITRLPFTYRDYYHQRVRWHIGMIQSLSSHRYMVGKLFYGWAGVLSGTFMLLYELFSPFAELLGILTLLLSCRLNILNPGLTLAAMLAYSSFVIVIQFVHIRAINLYRVESVAFRESMLLLAMSVLELLFFHPMNILIKSMAFLKYNQKKRTWKHSRRV